MDNEDRFSGRASDYRAARPGYAAGALQHILDELSLNSASAIADVGSGTGILSEQLLSALSGDVVVFGVEPNRSMRTQAEDNLRRDRRFRSVDGNAENTGLSDHSVDAITVAQASHWFDLQRTRAEFKRILRPGGRVALVWNMRSETADAFHRDYEQYLRDSSANYLDVRETWMVRRRLDSFFVGGHSEQRFEYSHELDASALRSRLLSSSYAPPKDSPHFERSMAELQRIFDTHQRQGTLVMRYNCECYCGSVA